MRFYVFKDSSMIAATATRDAAIDLIHQYQDLETHPFLRSEFSIIAGEEEFIPYRTAKKGRKARR